MAEPNDPTCRHCRTERMEIGTPVGPIDRLFSSPALSVAYHRVRVGAIGLHRHSQTTLTFTLEGASGMLRQHLPCGTSRELPISGHQVICTPPDIEHEGHWDTEADVIEIYLEPQFLRCVPPQHVAAVLARESLPEAKTDAVLWELVAAVCFLCSESEPDAPLILDDAALIARRLFSSHSMSRTATRGRKLTNEQRKRMEKFIEANLGEHFRVPQLSRAVGLSQQQFTPLCRNTTGKSPMEYVWECRLWKARELAQTGKCTRREIAHVCGFSDVSHLNRRFKAYFRFPLRVLIDSANRSKQS